MKVKTGFVCLVLSNICSLAVLAQMHPYVVGDKFAKKLPADKAFINAKTAEVVLVQGDSRVALKKEVISTIDALASTPDLVFHIQAPEAGTYQMSTHAIPAGNGEELKKDAQGNLIASYIKIQVGAQRPTKRILYDTHEAGEQVSGKFELDGKDQELRVWLPKGIQLGYIEWKNYNPPEIPLEARNYVPKIVPPAGHPRLWVTPQTLPLIQSRLKEGDNQEQWAKVTAAARTPYKFDFDLRKEIFYQEELEKSIQIKAFYYLMTGDKKVGGEAVKLMLNYAKVLEFGNVKYGDITREIGRAIYTSALVYDWCFDLLNAVNKQLLCNKMLLLAREMEIGWPPFMDNIVNGHGNEAQISRDLLSMSIALYDQRPELYKYTAYTVLENLVPMRKFEYESSRHNQGVDYGAYRFGWEMYAVWLFYRMIGTPVFDDNIKKLPYYWLYMRLPDGYMLRDGDMFSIKYGGARPLFWKQPQTMLLSYAYANDPLIKGEFEREGGLPDDPVLFLLVNDPKLKGQPDLTTLPLTKDFGTVLGSMVARTGWDNHESSNDVVAEIKGGGYQFGNHQHADAGALQLYYHGMQLGDIGLYLSYGSAYDYNFNKRSIAHSLMLAIDPHEQLLFRAKVNDGGVRFNQRFPLTPQEVVSDSWFDNGKVLSADFGPAKQHPAFSYFKVDLTGAYSAKMNSYTRGFCFLNMGREDVPALIILTDDMTTNKAEFHKYWQINTLNKPEETGADLVLHNELDGLVGKTHVNMLLPVTSDRKMDILSGKEANSTFGQQYEVNSKKPEATAYRIMISPKRESQRDRFLTVFQMTAGNAKPLPLDFKEAGERYQLVVADRVVSIGAGANLASLPFKVNVAGNPNATYQFALLGLRPGFWNIKSADGKVNFNFDVIPSKNTLYFRGSAGKYTVTPGRAYEAKELRE